MVCNVCNGIYDSFVMVLEFSVMVLLFFKPGLIKLCTSVHFLCDTVLRTYCTFRRSFKEKCPLSGAKNRLIREPWHVLLC